MVSVVITYTGIQARSCVRLLAAFIYPFRRVCIFFWYIIIIIIICIEALKKNVHTISYQDKCVRSGSRDFQYYVFRKFLAFCMKLW